MVKRPSIIYAALTRLDSLIATRWNSYGIQQAEWAISEDQHRLVTAASIMSHEARTIYQRHLLDFVSWVRSRYGIKDFEQLQERADELATAYLTEQFATGNSSATVQAQRAVLRITLRNEQLAETVVIPQ